MGRIVEVAQPYNFDEIVATKGAGYKPDFRILTAGIESTGANLVHMVGSSTEKDLQGDTMSIYALNSMTKAAPNLTVWLNHNYDLPDSMFGSIVRTPSIQHTAGVADLHLDVDVELENPAAAKVKRYIDNGRRLGCSIGCMVTKYEIADGVDEEELSIFDMAPVIIHDVYVVEYSVVGIPANQRSWVENAIRGVFQRTLDPELAPAMKGLWPTQFRDTLKAANGVISKAHYKSLEDAPARKRPESRLDWLTETKSFVLTHKGVQKTLQRDEVESVVNGSVIDLTDTQPSTEMKDIDVEEVKEGIPNEINPQEPENEGQPDHDDGPWDQEHLVKLHTDGMTHDAFNGAHTHMHDAFGWEGELTHEHTHTHKNDNNHNHDHNIAMEKDSNVDPTKIASGDAPELQKSEDAPVETPETQTPAVQEVQAEAEPQETKDAEDAPSVDPMKLEFLASYNRFGKTLGLPEVTAEMMQKAQHPLVVEQKDMAPDMLMQLQSIHDTVANASGGRVCTNASPTDVANQGAEQSGEDVSDQEYTVINSLSHNLALFAKTFEGLDVLATKKDVEDTAALLVAAKKQLSDLTGEITRAHQTLAQLKNMPLGNPLQHARSVQPDENAVTHSELLTITDSRKSSEPLAANSLSQAFALTDIQELQQGNGQIMRVRHWPNNVGGTVEKGVRPTLTAKQIQFMAWEDITNYRNGREAYVPYLDSQIETTV